VRREGGREGEREGGREGSREGPAGELAETEKERKRGGKFE